jgi:hypothetical protein
VDLGLTEILCDLDRGDGNETGDARVLYVSLYELTELLPQQGIDPLRSSRHGSRSFRNETALSLLDALAPVGLDVPLAVVG